MLKKLSLQALQFAMNQAIGLDETMPHKLKIFDDKLIEIIVAPLQVHFYMGFQKGQIKLSNEIERAPDTIIHSSPIGFIRLSFLPASKMRSLFNDDIKISGDIELGQRLKKIMDSMAIDWEGHLAHFTGDVAAHHIGKVFRKGRAVQKKYTQNFQDQTKDYLLYELQWTPSKAELERFYENVDDLRLRAERLEAHVKYLSVKHEKN